MQFGHAIAAACSSFAVTNIDDIFVLVTFFAEATTSETLTPWKIVIGQYVGFTIIITISMIGYAASFLFDPEPIGFLGLLPISLGVWKLLGLVFKDADEPMAAVGASSAIKAIVTVASVTVMNGGDNVGTYIPLFSQVKGSTIAVYVVVYYIMLGLWILAAWLILKQRHILWIAQRYARRLVPFLYIGLGTFIVINSGCYEWSIEKINDDLSSSPVNEPGRIILPVLTAFLLLCSIGVMIWLRVRARRAVKSSQIQPEDDQGRSDATTELTSPEVRQDSRALATTSTR